MVLLKVLSIVYRGVGVWCGCITLVCGGVCGGGGQMCVGTMYVYVIHWRWLSNYHLCTCS